MKFDRTVAADDAAFMDYVPLVAALLDQAACQSCCDYDDLAYHRNRTLLVEAKQTNEASLARADMVISIDALDDLTPPQVDGALDEIASLTNRLALIVVHRTVANAAAGDPVGWLLGKVGARFDLIHFQDCDKGFVILACPAAAYPALNAEIELTALVRTMVNLTPREAKMRRVRRVVDGAKEAIEVRWLAFWDDRTPRFVKILALLACVLALSPVDLTPDFIPQVGYLDDLAVLAFATVLVSKLLSPEIVQDLRLRAASVDHVRAVRGSFAITFIWLAALIVTALHALRPVI